MKWSEACFNSILCLYDILLCYFFSNILIIEILILQKYKTTKQFKKKGCLHYDKLSTIFGDTIASSANQHPSTKSPSISDDDDGEEHDDDQDEHSSQKKRRHLLVLIRRKENQEKKTFK